MNPIEAIALKFLKHQLASNPQLAANFVTHLLEQKKVDPAIIAGVGEAIIEMVPFLLAEIPS